MNRAAHSFDIHGAWEPDSPVVLSVPHAGRDYPAALLAAIRVPVAVLQILEDRHVDQLGEAVPRRLPGSGEIWRGRLAPAELAARIAGIHRAYHAFLAAELARIRAQWGAALLIDLHSMPPLRPAEGEERAPVIVLGDRFGAVCHHGLMGRAQLHLETRGCPAAQNRPYSGGYVLDRHGDPQGGVHALQIEVCRASYLDQRLAEPGAGLVGIAALLATLVRELGAETALLGGGDGMLQAAE
jgi:N-formylglutamate amidohydrolase